MALQRLDTKVLLSKLIPQDWDWNQVHPAYGTPLMSTVNEGVRLGTNSSDGAPLWRLLGHLLSQGADPRKLAGKVTGQICSWGDNREFPQLEWVKCENHSAISLVYAILGQLEKHEKQYSMQIKNCEKMLQVFSTFEPEAHAGKLWIAEEVVDLWEQVRGNLQEDGENFGDVKLEIVQPTGATVMLRAHSVVLRAASRVLKGMLAAPMREGATGIIRVEGASAEAATLCLHLIYTGLISGVDVPLPQTLLGAIDLAHRWQVDHVVAMLERGLAKTVTAACLADVFEAAVLKDLPVLRSACKAFAEKDAKHQGVLAQKLAEMQRSKMSSACVGESGAEAKKRRRTL